MTIFVETNNFITLYNYILKIKWYNKTCPHNLSIT